MKICHLLFFTLVVFMLGSCYSDDVNMRTEAHYSAVYSPDSSIIYFAGYTHVWQDAKGLYALPDGGKPKELYKNISLYSYDIKNQRLNRLLDCGGLPYSLSRWDIKIIPGTSEVSFSIVPALGWDQEIYYDSSMVNIKQKFDKVFRVTARGEIIPGSSHLTEENVQRVNLTILYNYIRELPLASFGLILEDIYPADEKQFVHDLVSLSNTSMYRRAVIEQIIAKKDQGSIKKIYDKMIKSMENLSGTERQVMEMKEEKNMELLREMLKE